MNEYCIYRNYKDDYYFMKLIKTFPDYTGSDGVDMPGGSDYKVLWHSGDEVIKKKGLSRMADKIETSEETWKYDIIKDVF